MDVERAPCFCCKPFNRFEFFDRLLEFISLDTGVADVGGCLFLRVFRAACGLCARRGRFYDVGDRFGQFR